MQSNHLPGSPLSLELAESSAIKPENNITVNAKGFTTQSFMRPRKSSDDQSVNSSDESSPSSYPELDDLESQPNNSGSDAGEEKQAAARGLKEILAEIKVFNKVLKAKVAKQEAEKERLRNLADELPPEDLMPYYESLYSCDDLALNDIHAMHEALNFIHAYGSPSLGKKPVYHAQDRKLIKDFYQLYRKAKIRLPVPDVDDSFLPSLRDKTLENSARNFNSEGTRVIIRSYLPTPPSKKGEEISTPLTTTAASAAASSTAPTFAQPQGSYFFARKRVPTGSQDWVRAMDSGNVIELIQLVGGNSQWLFMPIPGNEQGNTFAMHALCSHVNPSAVLSAFLPPGVLSAKVVRQLLSSENTNRLGESLISMAMNGRLEALKGGIAMAAVLAGKDPESLTGLIDKAVSDRLPTGSSVVAASTFTAASAVTKASGNKRKVEGKDEEAKGEESDFDVDPTTPSTTSTPLVASTSSDRPSLFAKKRRVMITHQDLVAAVDSGNVVQLSQLVGGSDEWLFKPIPGNERGDNFFMYALRSNANPSGMISALLPPFAISAKIVERLLSTQNTNRLGESVLSLAMNGRVNVLKDGIVMAASQAGKSGEALAALVDRTVQNQTAKSNFIVQGPRFG